MTQTEAHKTAPKALLSQTRVDHGQISDYKKIVKTAYPYLNFLFLSFAKKFCEYH